MSRAAPTTRRPLLAAIAGTIAAGALALTLSPAPGQAQTVRSGTGADAAALLPFVDQFRLDLGGGPPNPNVPGSLGSGRREINWEGVPLGQVSPDPFPPDFFNDPVTPNRARGVVTTTPGAELQVSSNADDGGFEYENLNLTYPSQFVPFSGQKLFTSIGSNIVDVHFFIPGTDTPALVRGFGAVFTDVDLPSTTSISYFGLNGQLLNEIFVDALNGGLSFLGATYDDDVVSMVRIRSGNTAVGPNDGPGVDVVVMDDFIYGEPVAIVPEPSTWLLLGTGLAGLALVRRRRRS